MYVLLPLIKRSTCRPCHPARAFFARPISLDIVLSFLQITYIHLKGPRGASLSSGSKASRQLVALAPGRLEPFRSCRRPQVGHRDIPLVKFPVPRKDACPEIFALCAFR